MEALFKQYTTWSSVRLLRHILYWGGWGFFYIIVNYVIDCKSTFWQWFSFEAVVIPIKVGCAYTIAYFLMPTFLQKKRWYAFLGFSILAILFWGYLLSLIYAKVVSPLIFDGPIYDHMTKMIYKVIELIHITSLVVCIKFYQSIHQKEKKNEILLREKLTSELKYLKNQVQPHFLFNTLNNLYGMVLSNNEKAPDAIIKLSNLLSYMLYESNDNYVPLDEEIKHIHDYIALERIRYDRKLDILVNIENTNPELEIAPLLLIPFIENAFKHGPAKSEKRSSLEIILITEDNLLKLHVSNTNNSITKSGDVLSGIGLQNVTRRLDLLYAGQYKLKVDDGNPYVLELSIEL